jgi:hypothetical protein
MIDWSIFRKAAPPILGEPTRLYRPEDSISVSRPDRRPLMRVSFCPGHDGMGWRPISAR